MNRLYDKFEQLAAIAQLSVCIFANPHGTDFALVGLDGAGNAGVMCNINARGLPFAGVMGLVDGVQRTELAEPLGDSLEDKMGALFVGYFVRRFLDAHPTASAEGQDDSEAFLWRL